MSNGKGSEWRKTDYKKYYANWPTSMNRKHINYDKNTMSTLQTLDGKRFRCKTRNMLEV